MIFWLMVAFGNHRPFIINAGYTNDPRKPSAARWCSVFLTFPDLQSVVSLFTYCLLFLSDPGSY